MKFNWGTGIAAFFLLFVGTMVFMVFKSAQYDHSLVVDKYYEEDLQYQRHYDKLAHNKQLTTDLKIDLLEKEGLIQFQFPKETQSVSGKILFFRPSDNSKDFQVPIKVNENQQFLFPTKSLASGLWHVKVDWSNNGKDYYKEEKIVI